MWISIQVQFITFWHNDNECGKKWNTKQSRDGPVNIWHGQQYIPVSRPPSSPFLFISPSLCWPMVQGGGSFSGYLNGLLVESYRPVCLRKKLLKRGSGDIDVVPYALHWQSVRCFGLGPFGLLWFSSLECYLNLYSYVHVRYSHSTCMLLPCVTKACALSRAVVLGTNRCFVINDHGTDLESTNQVQIIDKWRINNQILWPIQFNSCIQPSPPSIFLGVFRSWKIL